MALIRGNPNKNNLSIGVLKMSGIVGQIVKTVAGMLSSSSAKSSSSSKKSSDNKSNDLISEVIYRNGNR